MEGTDACLGKHQLMLQPPFLVRSIAHYTGRSFGHRVRGERIWLRGTILVPASKRALVTKQVSLTVHRSRQFSEGTGARGWASTRPPGKESSNKPSIYALAIAAIGLSRVLLLHANIALLVHKGEFIHAGALIGKKHPFSENVPTKSI